MFFSFFFPLVPIWLMFCVEKVKQQCLCASPERDLGNRTRHRHATVLAFFLLYMQIKTIVRVSWECFEKEKKKMAEN